MGRDDSEEEALGQHRTLNPFRGGLDMRAPLLPFKPHLHDHRLCVA
jgi:hypothetical protein